MVSRGLHRVPLGFHPPFSLSVLNPQGTRCGPRKGIMFWMERLIIKLVSRRGGRKRGASQTEDTEVTGGEWQDLGEARGLEGESWAGLFPGA